MGGFATPDPSAVAQEQVTPVESTVAEASSSTPAEVNDFEQLSLWDSDTEAPAEPEPTPEVSPVVEQPVAAPAPTKVEQPAVATPVAQPVQQQVAMPQSPQTSQPVYSTPAPQPTTQPAQATAEQIAQARASALTELEQRYAAEFSPEEREMAITDPVAFVSKVMARVTMNAYDLQRQQIQSYVPGMVHQIQAFNEASNSVERQFFAEYPDLNRPEYMETIQQIGYAFRQQNPYVSNDVAIRAVGDMTRGLLRLPTPQAQAVPTAPAVPAAQKLPPHVPTGSYASRGGAPTVVQNPWAELADIEVSL